jgi:outer membrane receptor protein involved in Fe transport
MRLLRTFGEADAPQVTVGVDWRRAEQQYQERNLDPDGQLMFFGNVFGIPESRMDDLGALVNLLVPWSDRVSFTVGGRVDWAQASLKADDPVVTESADPAQWYFGPGFEEPNWTLGMAYATGNIRLTEQHTLNVGTGYAMRAPDLAELYTDEPYTPLVRFGNSYVNGLSTLETERNWQVDLGLDGQHDCFHYGIRGFHATINDYLALAPAFIDPAPPDAVDAPKVLGRDFSYFPPQWRQDLGTANENADTAQAGYQYVNVDMATMFGGDLSGEIQLLDWLAVFGTMAYVRGTSHRPVTFVAADSWSSPDGAQVPLGRPEALPGIYPFRGTLAVRTFDPDRRQDRWGLELGSRMVSRHNYLAESLSELGTPGYTVFHLHGYYRLREHVRLTVRINNLLDRHYTEPGSLAIIGPSGLPTFVAEPGISALIGLDARF